MRDRPLVMDKQQLSEELECPICCQTPRNPPIFECENGHLICCVCRPKMNDKCPQVRIEIGLLALEAF